MLLPLATLLALSAALAQPCSPHWGPGTGQPGPGGIVYASVEWDPDGPGPLPTVLVAAGSFPTAGAVPAPSIATWDGQSWSPLGDINQWDPAPGPVRTLCVFNGELIAGGSNFYCGNNPNLYACNPVVRWTGTTWQTLPACPLRSVSAMIVHDGSLIVNGANSASLGNYITVRWNGATWQELLPPNIYSTTAITSFAAYSGDLYAVFNNNSVYRSDGSAWVSVGAGAPPDSNQPTQIAALLTLDGYLYAAGQFANPAGQFATGIVRWDGSTWTSILVGINTSGFDAYSFSTLAAFDHKLVAIGSFASNQGGNAPIGVQVWDGASWTNPLRSPFNIYSMTNFRGSLVVDGRRVWDGSTWSYLGTGTDGPITHLYEWRGDTVASGYFTIIDGVPAEGLARWDGHHWHPIPTRPGSDPFYIRAIGEYQGDLVVSGDFQTIGGVLSPAVARWDGQSWHTMNNTLEDHPFIRGMTEHQGFLYAAGSYWDSPTLPRGTVFRYDGTHWTVIARETLFTSYSLGARIASFGDNLFVAAYLPNLSSSQTSSGPWIYRFDGTTWTQETHIVAANPGVTSFCIHNNTLLAAGYFQTVNGLATPLASWNGSAWQGVPTPSSVHPVDLCSVNGSLCAASPSNVWRQDGSTWTTIGAMNGRYSSFDHALGRRGGELLVGGWFNGINTTMSSYIARYTTSPTCAPDFDCSGSLSVQDIFAFIGSWFAGDASADFNGSGLGVDDVFEFLNAWFYGCP